MTHPRRFTRRSARALVPIALAASLAAAACVPARVREVRVDREALGTVVSVTAYGRDRGAVRARIETAFAEIAAVEGVLDAWSPTSTVAALNACWAKDPSAEQTLPPEARQVMSAIADLGVGDEFSPALWGVSNLYDFEGARTVPSTATARLAASWELVGDETAHFETRVHLRGPFGMPKFASPGLDFGGASKGLALDRAAAALNSSGEVDAALVSAGSTTITFGEKPGDGPWRIGAEDPREPGRVVAVIEATGAVTVSTSGDYQLHFERDGVNWHHILDPATGLPARGTRSVTVIGAEDGLRSDILSTALFVMGPARAAEYAREHGLGLYLVDAAGAVTTVGPPAGADWRIVEKAAPRR